MRTHGWGGATPPGDDDEAARRIVVAAGELMDSGAAGVNIRQVAQKLGVARQTVYRYFPDTNALLAATAEHATDEFLTDLARSLAGQTEPSRAVVEAIATTFERLRENRRFSLLFTRNGTGRFSAEVTSPQAVALGRVIVEHLDVDWAAHGWGDEDINELVEVMLRFVQSLLLDPPNPGRTPAQLRGFLQRWVGVAVDSRDRLRDVLA